MGCSSSMIIVWLSQIFSKWCHYHDRWQPATDILRSECLPGPGCNFHVETLCCLASRFGRDHRWFCLSSPVGMIFDYVLYLSWVQSPWISVLERANSRLIYLYVSELLWKRNVVAATLYALLSNNDLVHVLAELPEWTWWLHDARIVLWTPVIQNFWILELRLPLTRLHRNACSALSVDGFNFSIFAFAAGDCFHCLVLKLRLPVAWFI